MRFMERAGRPTEVQVKSILPLKSAVPCDLMERPIRGQTYPLSPLRFHIRPHQIVTIRTRTATSE